MFKNRRLLTLVLASTLLLSACGFKLRGTILGGDLPFKSIYIAAPENSTLGSELRRYIRGSGELEIKQRAEDAEAILEIVSETRNKVILSLNSQGRVREYVLYYHVTIRVRNNAGVEYMAPTLITLKRDLSYNESQVLAKEAEEAMLYRDMQSDLVQQILRRMAAIKPADDATAD
ncbi:LPS assembly lipoprotein LptE [Herminiimonas glaciei]|uniref:LPS-assembly lipoprotein LptE n=1 Tax=Herminiimonas glaciei TaxID=523788 RepID=A0ABW2IEW8_9BURK